MQSETDRPTQPSLAEANQTPAVFKSSLKMVGSLSTPFMETSTTAAMVELNNKMGERTVYFEVYSTQQWNEDQRARLIRSYENSMADQTAFRMAMGTIINRIGQGFTIWAEKLKPHVVQAVHVRSDVQH